MNKEEEIRELRFLLNMVNNRLLYSNKPYTLTINGMQKEIRTLEELREILELCEQPIEIKLDRKEFNSGKRRT